MDALAGLGESAFVDGVAGQEASAALRLTDRADSAWARMSWISRAMRARSSSAAAFFSAATARRSWARACSACSARARYAPRAYPISQQPQNVTTSPSHRAPGGPSTAVVTTVASTATVRIASEVSRRRPSAAITTATDATAAAGPLAPTTASAPPLPASMISAAGRTAGRLGPIAQAHQPTTSRPERQSATGERRHSTSAQTVAAVSATTRADSYHGRPCGGPGRKRMGSS